VLYLKPCEDCSFREVCKYRERLFDNFSGAFREAETWIEIVQDFPEETTVVVDLYLCKHYREAGEK